MAEQTRLKVVVTGDPGVGKTTLTLRYLNNQFVEEYVPNVYDTFSVEKVIDGQNYFIEIIDAAGGEDYDKLRPLSYGGTSAFLLLFSIVKPETLNSVRTKWKPEFDQHAPNTPIILVGAKVDLRDKPDVLQNLEKKGQKPVTREQADAMRKEIGALAYIETSALTGANVPDAFEEFIKSTNRPREDPKGRCVIA